MKKKVSLQVNVVFSFISQLICYLTPLIVSPYVSRVLLPEGVGIYSHANSLVFYFSSITAFGFSSYGISKIASLRNDKTAYSSYFWSIFFDRFIIGLFSIFLYIVFLFTGVFKSENIHIGLALILVVVGNILENSFLFQGLENFRIVSYATVISNALYLLCVFLFVKSINDVLVYTFIKSSINIVIYLILWIISIKYLSKPSFSKFEMWESLKGSAVFFLPSILMSIGGQIDQTFLGFFVSVEEVGYYQQASKFPTLISNFTYAISPVMLSRISYLFSEKKYEEVKEKISKGIVLAMAISIPCCIGMYSIARYFVPLYFGEAFKPSILLMYLLLPTTFTSPISSILINSYFYPSGQIKKVTFSLFSSLLFNVVMTVINVMVFKMGGAGAALGTLISDFLLLLFLLASSKKNINLKFIGKDLIKISMSCGLMGLVLFLLDLYVPIKEIYLIILNILIGLVVYVVLTIFMKEHIIWYIIAIIKKRGKLKNVDR